ncbi:MAG: hypothetical protein EAZ20_14240 [Bacteroidetes bacterium]|nr:MAG: hypothetical protein EAZ20_14240 [Bacteroidota bacterium]
MDRTELKFYIKYIFAPACVPQAVVVGVRFVCYNIRLWDTSEGVKSKIILDRTELKFYIKYICYKNKTYHK